jgi:hypothetical protein
MTGVHDPLRRALPLGLLAALVVFSTAPTARADDASAAAAAATGAVIAQQAQPANVNVSVRVDSPGENGSVTQVNSAGGTSAAGVDGASAADAASASATGAQAAPANVNVSVRVGSSGNDGAVTQTNTTGGAAAAGTSSSTAGGATSPAAAASDQGASTPAATASNDPAPPAKDTPASASHDEPAASASGSSASAPGVTVSDKGASVLDVVSTTQDAARTPASSASNSGASTPAASASSAGASTPAANASSDGASAAGIPDNWTWVWNWSGACTAAPTGAPRSGWTWVWNWTCDDGGQPGPASPPGSGQQDPQDGTPATVLDTPAAPADASPVAMGGPSLGTATAQRGGRDRSHGPGASGAAASQVLGATAGAPLTSTQIDFTQIGVARPAPQARAASPAAQATPARERGRRGGLGTGGGKLPASPFDPDPTTPLAAGTASSGGGTGFVLLLVIALLGAVSLADPAGLTTRVATAIHRGLVGGDRRIDRPG